MNNEFLLSPDCEPIRKQKPKKYYHPNNDDSGVNKEYERSKKIDKWIGRVVFGVIPILGAVFALVFGPAASPVMLAILGGFMTLMAEITIGLFAGILLMYS